jgi:hypothetical protein
MLQPVTVALVALGAAVCAILWWAYAKTTRPKPPDEWRQF